MDAFAEIFAAVALEGFAEVFLTTPLVYRRLGADGQPQDTPVHARVVEQPAGARVVRRRFTVSVADVPDAKRGDRVVQGGETWIVQTVRTSAAGLVELQGERASECT